MKKTLKMILTTCLLLLAVCGTSLSVSARTTYFKGLISIDPSFPDSTFDANEQINFPFTVTCYPSNQLSYSFSKCFCDVYDLITNSYPALIITFQTWHQQ